MLYVDSIIIISFIYLSHQIQSLLVKGDQKFHLNDQTVVFSSLYVYINRWAIMLAETILCGHAGPAVL